MLASPLLWLWHDFVTDSSGGDCLGACWTLWDVLKTSSLHATLWSKVITNYIKFMLMCSVSDVPEPNITVYRQMEDRESVIVLCRSAKEFVMMYRRSFDLFVESELNYTVELLEWTLSDSSVMYIFMVTVSPPASFTCVHKFHFRNLHSQTYNYSGSVLDHHEGGVSSFYICFSSFIAVGLLIMTAAVIVANIRSKTKDAPVPIITVYQQIQDREQVIVMCSFGRRHYRSSFLLSVDCEQNYTLKNPECIAHDVCVFNITVRPPVSLTCIHEIITYGYESYVQSETYVLDYHDGVSSFYIGFFSFIVVGVIIMTAAVIVTTVRSNAQDAPVPIITVYQQIQDREQVIVMCSFGRRHIESSFQLSVDCEQNYTLKNPECIAHDVCVFNITVRPPVSLTCIHEIITYGYESYLQSETYVLDYHDGVSSFYIGFFSFIVVGVIIMTAAVIVTTVRSNAQVSLSKIIRKLSSLIYDSMNQLYILLVLWTACNSSDGWYWNYHSTPAPTTSSSLCWYWYNRPCNWDTTQTPYRRNTYYQTQTQAPFWWKLYYYATTQTPYRRNVYYQTQTPFWHIQDGHHSDVPVPNITVFRQMEDRERVIVICSFGRNLIESSFQLSVKSKYNYAFKNPQCFSNAVCVFDVKVSPPVSFTCVHQINSVVNRQSETYIYSQSDSASDPHCSDPHDGGVSSFYMSFFSFIAVGLFIMIAAVIMVTIKSKAKGSKNTASYNDYIDV
ncbi:hypothetical protein Q8A67_009655 [Cirrhinus molitorella]|uniref:Uncharacterized protein n=1 Tax=Cirrhinus molitorella TaxID=172907 RepID=A0AA88PV61_9TELE|nr:hypothetical protein Q8A67_009655 [Cirrhinus molitorella]